MNDQSASPPLPSPRPHSRPQALLALSLLGVGLIAVLILHLLVALLTGLTVFVLHRSLTAWLVARGMAHQRAHRLSLSLVLLAIAASLTGLVFLLDDFGFGRANGALVRLTDLLDISLDRLRTSLPGVISEHLPASVDALRTDAVTWLRTHVSDLRTWGTATARLGAHLLVGLVIGLLAAGAGPASPGRSDTPAFLAAWRHGINRLTHVFSAVMGAQVRIAALNAALTAIFLFAVVPLLGHHVPLSKTLVAVTFVAGLLPVIGNLVSNTAVVLTALTVSPSLALLALAFLIAVHKLEYFLNARLIGARIQARTFELLTVMLLMESIFGLGGVVASPLYYAWLMGILRDAEWV